MFSSSDLEFISNSMKIVVGSIESKLDEEFFVNYKLIAISMIVKYIEAIKSFETSGVKRDLQSSKDNEAEKIINSHYCDVVECLTDDDVIQVFDALRHAFSNYAYNGLHQLYTKQENENWYPKIILTDILEPNDIDSLCDKLILYRGCDIKEYESKDYGQAWTTSLDVAKKFAYINYSDQDWFNKEVRVVLQTIYYKENVLFSHQLVEFEVVIDTSKLDVVLKCI